MKKFNRICAEIDLDAIAWDFEAMRSNIRSDTKIAAVIKTDGYGHGALPIARLLEDYDYVWGYAVATVEEAVSLKEKGIRKPLLILGYVFEEDYDTLVSKEIRPVVFKMDMAVKMSEAAVRAGRKLPIHLGVDTGMTRIGFSDTKESVRTIYKISQLPGLEIEGMFTHFSKADELDKNHARSQVLRYIRFLNMLQKVGIEIPIKHCSNSAGILDMPEANMDMVRAGITCYGIYPSEEVSRNKVILKPAMSLKSHIIFIKEVARGIPVSYGGTYVTTRDTRIATIPVGYGDGYPRSLSGRGWVLIHGKKAPILGRVCMDHFMVDVTGIPEAQELDEVVLMGESGDSTLSVEELGRISGRFPYEFVCDIGKRVPRVYYREGKAVEARECLNE